MENMNLSKQDIINRISYFRNKKNISAYKLGLELGHAKTYFYRIESGEIELSIDGLLDVLQILGVSTAEFFCPFLENQDIELFNQIKSMSDENKKTIQDLIYKLNK